MACGSQGIKSKPVSRFKALRESASSPTKNKTPEKKKAEGVLDSKSVNGTTPNAPQLDCSNMQDIDTMAKAYSMGMYDDDVDVEGPLVEDLKDFEKINKIVESRDRRKDQLIGSTGGETYDKKSNEVGMDYEDTADIDDYDENETMMNDIEEHEFDEDVLGEANDENEITNQELSDSYHRMREKMLLRNRANQEEQGFEPTDEEGAPVRISKFKARMNK
ncbi:hypothetical protein KGF57_004963 [Candida theae]|uniref:DUF3835 domain-containing protein n=1 Tax=Candida theae TaxID=1198502 RepID=A0AAD5BB90_9ASCO|nr:uncharacterized protein KGF57_004963 [Candida theae]KAI5949133.1 hypothetical protein KGF57_004963 [Candida theae]